MGLCQCCPTIFIYPPAQTTISIITFIISFLQEQSARVIMTQRTEKLEASKCANSSYDAIRA